MPTDPTDPNVERPTRTAHGEPIGTSREEEALQKDGLMPDTLEEAREDAKHQGPQGREQPLHGGGKKESGDEPLLERTQDGYREIREDEIPLSDRTGEGRVDPE